jgi:hypothetical protein
MKGGQTAKEWPEINYYFYLFFIFYLFHLLSQQANAQSAS